MRLKLSSLNLGERVITVNDDVTIGEFARAASDAFENKLIPGTVAFGFPPKKLNIETEDGTKLLTGIGVSSGERISIQSSQDCIEVKTKHKVEAQTNPKTGELAPTSVPLSDGSVLTVHEVPDDNSCLFHAISYAVYKEITIAQQLREIVAQEVLINKLEYSESILGKPNKEYAQWISKNTSWGGGIEIAILSKHIQIAIFVLDIDAERFEKFNEDKYPMFIILAFSGIHYDTVELVSPQNKVTQTVFSIDDSMTDVILTRAADIAKRMKAAGLSFNTHRGHIKCNICGTVLVGEREVARHAENTGHVDFGQVNA